MRRRSISVAMLGAAVVLGLAVASAAALSPPPGTPDLSQMTIQAGDLAPGATFSLDGYTKPPRNFIADYDRNFKTVRTPGGLNVFGLHTQILLGKSTAVATAFFALQRGTYRSKLGRSLLAKELESLVGTKGVTISKVHFEKFRRLALGSDAFVQPVLLHVNHVELAADIVVLRHGAVVSSMSFILTDPTPTLSVATQLGKDVNDHITAVLAGTGSTGATGPTGTT